MFSPQGHCTPSGHSGEWGAFQEVPVAMSPTTLSLFDGSAEIPHRGRKHILRTQLQRQGRERCRMKSLQWPHHAGPALPSGFLPRAGPFPVVEPFFFCHISLIMGKYFLNWAHFKLYLKHNIGEYNFHVHREEMSTRMHPLGVNSMLPCPGRAGDPRLNDPLLDDGAHGVD